MPSKQSISAKWKRSTWRVLAHDLEQIVIDIVSSFLRDGGAIHGAIKIDDGINVEIAIERASVAAASLSYENAASQRTVLQDIVERIDLHDDHVDIALNLSSLAPAVDSSHRLSFPVQRVRRGQVVKLILPAPSQTSPTGTAG